MGHLPFDPSKLSPPDLALYNGMVERRKAQGAGSAILNHPPLPDFSRRSVFRFREAVWSL